MSKLTNNVVPSGPPQWNRFQDQIGSSNLSIAGGPIRGNNYLIDGIPITSSQNLAIVIPSQSAVQEMKLQENTYDATMGRTGGGVFNTVIASGSNGMHGDALGYYRTTDFTANNYFLNMAGKPRQSELWENWEFSLGGPVVIPKVYNGKNKTFFFVSTEGYLEAQPDTGSFAVPTAAVLGGNFQNSGRIIYDPLSGRPCTPADNCPAGATVIRTPFQNNIIPAGQLSRIGQSMLGYLPAPNTNLGGSLGQSNFAGGDTLGNHAEEFVYKLDEDPTPWLRLGGSFIYYKSFEPGSNFLNILPGKGSYRLYRHVDATALNSTITVNPTTVLSVRYGFNRFPNIYNYPSYGFDQTTLGFPASYVNQIQTPEFPLVTLSQTGESYGGGTHQQTSYWSKNAAFGVSKFVGKHNITAGFDYRLIHTDGAQFINGPGTFSFNGIFTQQFNAGNSATTGSDFADALLGYPSSGLIGTATNTYFFVNYYAGYIQDDIHVSNRLTLNVGLRYEYETGQAEQFNNMLVGFDRTAVNPIQAQLSAGSGVLATGVPLIAGQNGNPTACCDALKTSSGRVSALRTRSTIRPRSAADGVSSTRPCFSRSTTPIRLVLPNHQLSCQHQRLRNGREFPQQSVSERSTSARQYHTGVSNCTAAPFTSRIRTAVRDASSNSPPISSGSCPGVLPRKSVILVSQQPSAIRPTANGLLPINQLPTQYMSQGSALSKSGSQSVPWIPGRRWCPRRRDRSSGAITAAVS